MVNICPPGRTFFTGEVGVVTWLVGLVGGDTVMLVGAGVVLLLTDAASLVFSGGDEKKRVVRVKNETKMNENKHEMCYINSKKMLSDFLFSYFGLLGICFPLFPIIVPFFLSFYVHVTRYIMQYCTTCQKSQ